MIVGWGDDIDWVAWNSSVSIAREKKQPIFLLIHRWWCRSCAGMLNVSINVFI